MLHCSLASCRFLAPYGKPFSKVIAGITLSRPQQTSMRAGTCEVPAFHHNLLFLAAKLRPDKSWLFMGPTALKDWLPESSRSPLKAPGCLTVRFWGFRVRPCTFMLNNGCCCCDYYHCYYFYAYSLLLRLVLLLVLLLPPPPLGTLIETPKCKV